MSLTNYFQWMDWLAECDGDSIWSREYCLQRGLPEHLVDALEDGLESGFRSDDQVIYVDDQPVNQYEGIRDVDLALWIGKQCKVDTKKHCQPIRVASLDRASDQRSD